MKKNYSNPFYRIVCWSFLFFIVNINAKASVINVPADYSTIQAAINAAQPGDMVLVQPGHYSETIFLKAGVSLKGVGLDVTFIDGGGTGNSTGSVVQIDGSGCSIEGFTIENANLNSLDNLGAGIDGNNFSFTARNNRIRNCRIGIRIINSTSGASSIVERNIIQDNPGLCGIGVNFSTNVQIINNTIYNSGRGIQYIGSSSLDLVNNIVMNNSQYGIVSFDNVVASIKYNDIYNNGTNYGLIPDQTGTNGNISANPSFVNDFKLAINSPCIDAGDPTTPPDPDGTRTDIGAYYYIECATCYCTSGLYDPTYGCTYGFAINDFTLANIHQTATGCSGELADYTSLTINLAQGESYLFNAVSSSPNSGSEYLGIWVDLNDNGSFEDEGELFFTSAAPEVLAGILTVPVTAPLGNHRMRVRLKYDYTYLNYGPITLTNSCTYYNYGEAHDYTVNISAEPSCKGLSSLSVAKIRKFSATVNWGCGGCTSPFIIEYGLAGFTPGTGSTAGTGGIIVNANSSPVTVSGLLSDTEYEVYVRRNCGTSGFSLNFGPVKFRTVYDACGTLQTITCNQVITETIIGKGEFDYYPNTGSSLEGKEKIYQFTPTVTGKYVLSVSNTNFITAYYFLKEASLGCDRYSWKQIGGAYSAPALILMGTLTAGTSYYLMLETQGPSWETQQEFKIECASDFKPCASIDPVNCNTQYDFVIPAGAGAFDVPMILSQWEQYVFPGKEKIFSYTPSSNGKIRLKVGSPDFAYGAGFFIKNSSDGCNSNLWTSMGYSTGFSSYYFWYSNAVEVTAGNTYYIMCDALDLTGRSLSVEISCPEIWEPCNSITPVTCGVPVNADIPAGLGKFDLPNSSNYCGYNTLPGKELIFSFTPAQTGFYKFDITGTEYKRINYLIKEAGLCNEEGWSCMGGAFTSGNFLTPFSLTAGHTYYILLDAEEVLTATSQTFIIDCTVPPDPCSSITSLACWQTLDISIPNGVSIFSPYLTNYGEMKGKEKIVQFTPSITGTYFLRITNRTGYSGTYAIKPASDGCTINNWVIINQSYYNNTSLIPLQLVAGTAYYILAENYYGQYNYGEVNETMEIVCPTETYDPCATITTITGCGVSVTSIHDPGIGSFVTTSSFFSYGSGIAGPAGKENIFQFTPSQTGWYLIKSVSGTGEVNFAIKEAAVGCNATGWLNIGKAGPPLQGENYPLLTIPIKLNAGTNYYMLVDAEDTIGATHTFQIFCPEVYDPCQSIQTIACGLNYTSVNIPEGPGTYIFNSGYNYASRGKEKIIEFTAFESGTHVLEISTSGMGEVWYKNKTDGCDNTDWIFMGQVSGYYYASLYPVLQKGQTYYFLLKAISYFGANVSINFYCAVDCKIYADTDEDGYGNVSQVFSECGMPLNMTGYSFLSGDCNDTNENVNPAAAEICGNHIDDDCDGAVDEGCSCTTTVTIAASDAVNSFCNGIQLTANSPDPVQSYSWSTGATTQSVFLTTANATGNYSVNVIDINGCTASAVYSYNPQLLTSSYTLLAKHSIDLEQHNTVVNGSVGVVQSKGSASIGKYASIAGPGAFLKAKNISLQRPYTIPRIIYAPATVTLPVMQYNTTSIAGLPNVSVRDGINITLSGNYKNVNIGSNCNVTLNGTRFGNITIGEKSNVLFTQSLVNVVSIDMQGGSNKKFTRLRFSGDAIVRSSGDITVREQSVINPENYKVIFYSGKPSSPADFTVGSGGNVIVNASIYIPNGKLNVGGNDKDHTNKKDKGNGEGDDNDNTYMNGKFIAEEIETTVKNVIWNWYECGSEEATRASNELLTVQQPEKEQPEKAEQEFSAKAWPNPSEQVFTLNVESVSNELVMLKVYDMYGRIVYSAAGSANKQYQFGNSFVSGTYVAEVRQGANRTTVKLIKQ